jgi:hypothetical protein
VRDGGSPFVGCSQRLVEEKPVEPPPLAWPGEPRQGGTRAACNLATGFMLTSGLGVHSLREA